MSLWKTIKAWFEKPVRFDYIGQYLTPGSHVLDVGCGSHAPYSTFRYFPNIHYSGIDILDTLGSVDMEYFYKLNIDNSLLNEIPNDYFDVILLSHLIEHIQHGELLIQELVKKLKPGGIIYIETPNERSLKFPSWYGTLNFYDDPTHKRVYSLKLLTELLKQNGCTIIHAAVRHNAKRILLSPLYIVVTLFRDKKVNATTLWDILGFAHFVIAKK